MTVARWPTPAEWAPTMALRTREVDPDAFYGNGIPLMANDGRAPRYVVLEQLWRSDDGRQEWRPVEWTT